MYYYRYLMTENQINSDIQRGYGFRFYDLHNTVTELVQNSPFIEMEPGFFEVEITDEMSDNEVLEALEDAGIDVRQDNATGMWGLAYDGLSAFGPFETAEEAEEAAAEWHYSGFDGQRFAHVAIVAGEPTGNVDDNDIDTIKVSKVVKVIAK